MCVSGVYNTQIVALLHQRWVVFHLNFCTWNPEGNMCKVRINGYDIACSILAVVCVSVGVCVCVCSWFKRFFWVELIRIKYLSYNILWVNVSRTIKICWKKEMTQHPFLYIKIIINCTIISIMHLTFSKRFCQGIFWIMLNGRVQIAASTTTKTVLCHFYDFVNIFIILSSANNIRIIFFWNGWWC